MEEMQEQKQKPRLVVDLALYEPCFKRMDRAYQKDRTRWVCSSGRVEKTAFSPGQDRFKTGLLIAYSLVSDSTRNKTESGSSHTAI
jgi:hypothetical protein